MSIRLVPLSGLSALLVSACAATSPSATDNRSAAQIHGSAYYVERIALPPDIALDVQLVNTRLADTPLAVVARQRYEHPQGPPYKFTLDYDPAKLQPNMSYALFATLTDADGHVWFVTDTSVPVTPGSKDTVELRMVRTTPPPR
ncbi:MAG: YbaY family lipoprotein [Rudaea sp.]|uniref:YbaY family lipoprotein n=1 Tax=unclassified Rudaea TaxID=2627037 RepID=UPI0010F98FFF|nr:MULTISPECIES: YbaY family lipoprotein [unclassified Rudaea]MBN8887882.1 YbaY family lipoprotein [Rudaea sp.]MBR0347432.1 YbaY family lipoprotein [Rudaea sp.]